jgi:hypothetical protein
MLQSVIRDRVYSRPIFCFRARTGVSKVGKFGAFEDELKRTYPQTARYHAASYSALWLTKAHDHAVPSCRNSTYTCGFVLIFAGINVSVLFDRWQNMLPLTLPVTHFVSRRTESDPPNYQFDPSACYTLGHNGLQQGAWLSVSGCNQFFRSPPDLSDFGRSLFAPFPCDELIAVPLLAGPRPQGVGSRQSACRQRPLVADPSGRN